MRWTEFAVKEARRTLSEWEQRIGPLTPPLAVEDLADLLYFLAIDTTQALPDTLAGRLYIEERIIEVRSSDPPTRQRFTIAHEIGHYRLHYVAEGGQLRLYDCATHAIQDAVAEDRPDLPSSEKSFSDTFAAASLLHKAEPPNTRRLEIEANAFAAELLMPAYLVEDAVQRYGTDLTALAEHFAVSLQAMRYRLEKLLLLLPPGPQTSFL
jgi:DNA helicase II / ATP-dependent DNA helicase PcrA